MTDWIVHCHISGICKHQLTRKMVLLFKCFGLIPSSRAASSQEHYKPELMYLHHAMAMNSKSFIDKNFFF